MSVLIESPMVVLAVATARGWTMLYTWRLPVDLQESRRAEIESDLWDHQQLARLAGEPVWQTALSILLRFLLGLPADLAWRLDVRATRRRTAKHLSTDEGSSAIRWAVRGANTITTIVVFVAFLLGCLSLVSGTASYNFWYAMFGVLTLIATVTTVWGLRISSCRQPLGILLVAGGSLTFSIAWFWWIMFTLPVSSGLIALSYIRGKRAAWRADSPSDITP